MPEIWLEDYEVKSTKEVCSCGNLMECKGFSKQIIGEGDGVFYTIQVFKILTCPACNLTTVLLYNAEGNEFEYAQSRDSGESTTHKYSRQILYGPKRQFHSAIPLPISDVVNQAQAVLANSPRASFILCRAVLEEVCNDFQIPSESTNDKGKRYFIALHNRLLELFKQENMPGDLQQIIQGIKDLGNEGAHAEHATFAEQVKFQEAENLLLLVNYVLERVYVDKIRQQEATETLTKLKERILSLEPSTDQTNYF